MCVSLFVFMQNYMLCVGMSQFHVVSAVTAGVRLYKEVPAEEPPSPPLPKPRGKEASGAKGKGAKGRGKKAKFQGGLGGSLVPPPAEPSWELLGSSTEELQAVGEDLTGSQANAEADIGYQVRKLQDLSYCGRASLHCRGTASTAQVLQQMLLASYQSCCLTGW